MAKGFGFAPRNMRLKKIRNGHERFSIKGKEFFLIDEFKSAIISFCVALDFIFISSKTLSDSEKRAEYDERIGISRKRPHGDVVDFDDFETDSEDEELISFRCRCSGKYFIERTDGEHLPLEVPCSDCSLFIYVDNT